MDDILLVNAYALQHFQHALEHAEQLAEDARDLELKNVARKFDRLAGVLRDTLKEIHDDRVATPFICDRCTVTSD